jgi:tRNA(Ile)-lysidine synthase
MKHLYPRFVEHIKKNRLLPRVRQVIAAFSGGKDSVTLLLLLKELREAYPFQLNAAYFNHRIRQDADREQAWVEDFCRRLEVPLTTGSAEVTAFKERERLNMEQAASLLRYRFLLDLVGNRPDARLATAHTRSDLVETFFIKLLRGSGLRGLGAIHQQKDTAIIRPLLIFTEEEVLAFLERNQIDYYRDPSNLDNRFLRNKIRHHLLPQVKKIEPDIEGHIADTAVICQAEDDYFARLSTDFLSRHLIMGRVLAVGPLTQEHIALQRHILRAYIQLLKGDLLDIGLSHIEAVLRDMSGKAGLCLPGLDLKFHKGFIFPANLSIPPYRYELETTGELHIREIDTRMRMEETDTYRQSPDNFSITIPRAAVRFPLVVRSPEKHDRYVKINADFPQQVFEMIRESGLPSELRHLRPLLTNADGRIIWSVGSPVADPFKIESTTKAPFLKISTSSPG